MNFIEAVKAVEEGKIVQLKNKANLFAKICEDLKKIPQPSLPRTFIQKWRLFLYCDHRGNFK